MGALQSVSQRCSGSSAKRSHDESADTGLQAPRAAPRSVQPPAAAPPEIHPPNVAPIQLAQDVVGPLLQPLATAAIVVVLLIFLLLQRENLRDRFIRLAGARDLRRTTEALDDAGRRLSRYLLMLTVINASFGLWIGTGLWLTGVPAAILLGVLSALLRFVPYVGPIAAAGIAGALATAVDPGWSMLLCVLGLFAITERIIEPWLYGRVLVQID